MWPGAQQWLILLVAVLQSPAAAEVVGEGVELPSGPAVCKQSMKAELL